MSIELLDCTLRDGGYYTLWDFESKLINHYLKFISQLPIKYIEIGYRSIEKEDYLGEFYYLPLETIKAIKSKLNKSQKIALMLNTKDCSTDSVVTLLSECTDFVDLIRLATDPKKIEHSLEISKILKSLGFKVGINIMYLSTIDKNHSIYNKIKDIEEYVDYLYLVDSYGSIYPTELENSIKEFQKNTKVNLGFHGHNNLELAFVNTLKALECGITMIDSTVLGMGRGAGNLKLELFLTHLKEKENWNVNFNILSQLVELFNPLMTKYKWGTNLPYMVSGSYSLPQKDVMDMIIIDRYSIASIVNTMNSDTLSPLQAFQYIPVVEKCIIIGGGSSVNKHLKAITNYLTKNKAIIIHSTSKYINDFSTLTNKQFFCIAGDELIKLNKNSQYNFIHQFIFGPSPRKVNISILDKYNVAELKSIDFIEKFHDSPLAISLQSAIDIKAKNIELIGFDGYTELKSTKELYLMQENQIIISSFSKQKNIISLTKTNYSDIIQKSIYSKVDL